MMRRIKKWGGNTLMIGPLTVGPASAFYVLGGAEAVTRIILL